MVGGLRLEADASELFPKNEQTALYVSTSQQFPFFLSRAKQSSSRPQGLTWEVVLVEAHPVQVGVLQDQVVELNLRGGDHLQTARVVLHQVLELDLRDHDIVTRPSSTMDTPPHTDTAFPVPLFAACALHVFSV